VSLNDGGGREDEEEFSRKGFSMLGTKVEGTFSWIPEGDRTRSIEKIKAEDQRIFRSLTRGTRPSVAPTLMRERLIFWTRQRGSPPSRVRVKASR